ncbi:MAG: hypothetical protein MJ085_02515 [Clostridia bacterium]|nr:hypothetical protein [Clostridia bacterium]
MEFKQTVSDFCDKAGEAAHSAADKTKALAKIGRYKVKIAKLQEQIRKAYQQLGKVYYKDFVTDEEPDEAEYDPLCQQISECYRRITILRDAIEDLKRSISGE